MINNPASQTFILIDKSATGLPTGWKNTSPQSNAIILDSTNNYYVDLRLISKDTATVADWLRTNQDYINFPESSWLIEAAYKVQDVDYTSLLDAIDPLTYTKYSWSQIQAAMSGMSPVFNPSNHFNEYLKIDDKDFTIVRSTYDTTCSIFSVVLFNCILSNRTFTSGNPDFYFAQTNIWGNDCIFFKVMDGSTFMGYYNYSKTPV